MNNFSVETIDPFSLPFVLLKNRRQLPDTKGVYFAIANDAVQYIGKTDAEHGFCGRWMAHNKFKDLRILGNVKIAYLELDVSASIEIVEQSFIRRFRPPLNKLLYESTAETLEQEIESLESLIIEMPPEEMESTLKSIQCSKRKLWLAKTVKGIRGDRTNYYAAQRLGIKTVAVGDMIKGKVDPDKLDGARWEILCRLLDSSYADLRNDMKNFAGMPRLANDFQQSDPRQILERIKNLPLDEQMRIAPYLLKLAVKAL